MKLINKPMNYSIFIGVINILLYSTVVFSQTLDERDLSPQESLQKNAPFFQLIVDIERKTNPLLSHKLSQAMERLKKRSVKKAAFIMRGIRFELQERLSIIGESQEAFRKNPRSLAPWIHTYSVQWLREIQDSDYIEYVKAKTNP